MNMSSQIERSVFRILLYGNNASELLVEITDRGLRLPSLEIPLHVRVAKEITSAILISWNLKTCCLFPRVHSLSPDTCIRYQVLEICEPQQRPPVNMRWIAIATMSDGVFDDNRDSTIVRESLEVIERYRTNSLPGPFAKPGWMRTVQQWAEQALTELHLSGVFHQFNASPTFSLIRFETNGPSLWFKAVGEPNIHEYSITTALANLVPGFVPNVLAARPDWNAWLSVEAEGVHLTGTSTPEDWRKTATALANLQIASIGHGLHLINAGCRDLRYCSLRTNVEPFFNRMADLMKRQTKPEPAPLTQSELVALAGQITLALEQLNASEIPNVLGHLDMNPGNVLVSEVRCIFLDWAEGCVGHPFLTFQYLLENWRRFHGTDVNAENALLSAYTEPWRSLVSPQNIARDLQAAPLLAVFAYAVANPDWEILAHPESFARLRSLTRRMRREVEAFSKRSFTCVN